MSTHVIAVRDYDLAATLSSGQAFRWRKAAQASGPHPTAAGTRFPASHISTEEWGPAATPARREQAGGPHRLTTAMSGVTPAPRWEGVIAGRWVRLTQTPEGIGAETAAPTTDWFWLEHYLNTTENLDAVLDRFPHSAALCAVVNDCRGLRLLQQEPWECLASFILSSTKQITQIQQIVERLCSRYGTPVLVPEGCPPAFAFPSPARLADTTEGELRECRMGFRARHLHAAARTVAEGALDLEALRGTPLPTARERLTQLSGVGRKIADCVLLFSLGHRQAFPVDVWIARALRTFYFKGRRVTDRELITFTESHFGPEAGYAQQYLFHYARRNPHLVNTAG